MKVLKAVRDWFERDWFDVPTVKLTREEAEKFEELDKKGNELNKQLWKLLEKVSKREKLNRWKVETNRYKLEYRLGRRHQESKIKYKKVKR